MSTLIGIFVVIYLSKGHGQDFLWNSIFLFLLFTCFSNEFLMISQHFNVSRRLITKIKSSQLTLWYVIKQGSCLVFLFFYVNGSINRYKLFRFEHKINTQFLVTSILGIYQCKQKSRVLLNLKLDDWHSNFGYLLSEIHY